MVEPQRSTDAVADRWWARDFGCSAAELRPSATRVQEHTGDLIGAPRIWILAVGPSPLVSLPAWAMDTLGERAHGWTRSLVADTSALVEAIRPLEVDRVVGPAAICYGTRETLDLARASEARALSPEDGEAATRLQAECSDAEWAHGGSNPEEAPTFGCFAGDGSLFALAGYKIWNQEIAHISIVSTPRVRGHGHASAAVACAAEHALDGGLVPQYRTLVSNAPSMAIARRLGFAEYGFSVSVRLAAR